MALVRKQATEETINLIEKGRLEIPDGVAAADFILADGKLAKPKKRTSPKPISRDHATPPPQLTLQSFFEQFFASIPDDNLEGSTIDAMRKHERHLLRVMKTDRSHEYIDQHMLVPHPEHEPISPPTRIANIHLLRTAGTYVNSYLAHVLAATHDDDNLALAWIDCQHV